MRRPLVISLEKKQLPPLQKPTSSRSYPQALRPTPNRSCETLAPSVLFASAESDRLDLQDKVTVTEPPSTTSSPPPSPSSSKSSGIWEKIKSLPSLVTSTVRTVLNRAFQGYENVSQWGVFSPLRKIKFFQRLHNAVDNGLGIPRFAKPVKALTWAGATLAVGLIPFPLFTPLIMASPVTFATTLLVDYFMGFWEGLSSDPVKMRERLDQAKQNQ
jgi:hypothetical protein